MPFVDMQRQLKTVLKINLTNEYYFVPNKIKTLILLVSYMCDFDLILKAFCFLLCGVKRCPNLTLPIPREGPHSQLSNELSRVNQG